MWGLPGASRAGFVPVRRVSSHFFRAVRVEALPGMAWIRAHAKCPGGMPRAHGAASMLLHG